MDDQFSCVSNTKRLSETELETVFRDLFTTSCEDFSEEVIAPEGAEGAQENGIELEVTNEWLTEEKLREKKERIVSQRSNQQREREKRAAEFEKLNESFNPPYPVPQGYPPGAVPVSDEEESSCGSAPL